MSKSPEDVEPERILIGIYIGSGSASIAFQLSSQKRPEMITWSRKNHTTVSLRVSEEMTENGIQYKWGHDANPEDSESLFGVLPWFHVDLSGTVGGVQVSSKIEYQLYQKCGQNHYHRNMLTGDEQQAISQRYLVDFVHFIKEYLEKELTSKYFSAYALMEKEVCIVVPAYISEDDVLIFENILRQEFMSMSSCVRFITQFHAALQSMQPLASEQAQLGNNVVVCNMEEEITTICYFRAISSHVVVRKWMVLAIGAYDIADQFQQCVEKRLANCSISGKVSAVALSKTISQLRTSFLESLYRRDIQRPEKFANLPQPLGPRFIIDEEQMREEVFDIVLNEIKEWITWATDGQQSIKLLLSGMLGECPYSIHFMRDGLPDILLVNAGDEATSLSRGAVSATRRLVSTYGADRKSGIYNIREIRGFPGVNRVARTRWLDQWETEIEGIIEDLQKSGTISEAVGNKMLTQQELIFIERLKRQSTYHPKTQMTTMRLQKWAMYFHQNDMKTRVGQSFYEAYSKERKAKLEKDDPRVSLLHFHLAASLNEADVIEIFKKTGFSMDESSPAPISSPTKFNTILETYSWYFPPSSDDTAFAQFILKDKEGNGFWFTRRSSQIAARRGCYSLLKLFEAHDTWTFGIESGVLYCLAKIGGHTKTAEWLYSHREKSPGLPPRRQFQDPLDGGIYLTSDWLDTAWQRDLASTFPPASLRREQRDGDESSDEVSSIEDRMSDFKSKDEYPDSDDAKATSVSISNRSTVTPLENRTASHTLVARPKVPQLQLVQSIVLNGGAPTMVDWTPSVHFQDYGHCVEVHAAVTGGIFMSWDASSGTRLHKARVVVKPMMRYAPWALSPDGTHLAYQQAGYDEPYQPVISVISTSAGAEIRRFDNEVRYPVSAITFSSDGRRLAFGTHIPERNAMPSKNVVQILDINSGKLVATLKVAHLVEDLEFSPDGRLLAVQSNGVKIYDLRTRKLAFDGEILGKDSIGAIFSPSGNFLAVWRDPGVIEVWEIDTPLLWADPLVQLSLPGHTSTHFGQSLAFSPDGRLLASSSEDDKIIRIWNLETREVLHMLEGYVIGVRRLEFSPDGQMVVSASMDGDVRLWKLPAHSNPKGVGEMQELQERIQDI